MASAGRPFGIQGINVIRMVDQIEIRMAGDRVAKMDGRVEVDLGAG